MGTEKSDQLAALVAALRNGVPLDQLSLPRARHQLSDEDVQESQRWRLLGATAQVVAEKGYWPATIREIAEAAGVSKKTFYEHFSTKEEVFLAAYDAIEVVIETVRVAIEYSSLERLLETTISAYLGLLEAAPELTQMLLFQALGATHAIRERRIGGIARYAAALQQVFDNGRRAGLPLAVVSTDELTALLGGINELCIEYIHANGVAGLATLAPTLCRFAGRVVRTEDD